MAIHEENDVAILQNRTRDQYDFKYERRTGKSDGSENTIYFLEDVT